MKFFAPRRSPHRSGRIALFLSVALTIVALAGCTSGGSASPTAAPSPTLTAVPSLAPGEVTVGSLLARIAGSWDKVQNVRSVFSTVVVSAATPGATPAVLQQTQVVTEEIKPDRRRVVTTLNGATTEEIRVGDKVFMRGAFVTQMVAPNVGPDTWVIVDPAVVSPDSPVGQEIAALTSPIEPPYQTVSDQMKQRAATPVGDITIAGRTCAAFAFADVSPNGGRINYTLAIDAQNMICSLTQSAGAVQNITTFTFNVSGLQIVTPDQATPVAATPEG